MACVKRYMPFGDVVEILLLVHVELSDWSC